MKKLIIYILFCLPVVGFGQLKQIGDTIWVEGIKFTPGDTLRLGEGSSPDKSFNYISTPPEIFKLKNRYLPEGVRYLIYKGREDFGIKGFKLFMPVFSALNDKNRYTISFPQAIDAKEVIL